MVRLLRSGERCFSNTPPPPFSELPGRRAVCVAPHVKGAGRGHHAGERRALCCGFNAAGPEMCRRNVNGRISEGSKSG